MNINIQFRLEHVQIFKVPLNSFNILTDCKDMIEKDTRSRVLARPVLLAQTGELASRLDTPYQQAPSLFKLKVSKAS